LEARLEVASSKGTERVIFSIYCFMRSLFSD
jgi:hypothetical protein